MSEFPMQDTITKDQTWVAPQAKNQEFDVYVWGGGGAGSCSSFEDPVSGAGGGSGYMNFGTFKINAGERVDITIGKGGTGVASTNALAFQNASVGESGSPTYFGNYIFASGGLGGNIAEGGVGGYNGGAPGQPGAGNFGSFGCSGNVGGVNYCSGGGGSAVNARGRGGSANMTLGDAGTSGGGAGCFVHAVDNAGIHRRTGNGGKGVCIIKYIRET